MAPDTGEHRSTGEHRTSHTGTFATTGTHATHTGTHTGTHTATRATPLGAAAIRGRGPGLRLYGVVSLDTHGGAPLAAGTELLTFRDVGAVVATSPYSADALSPQDMDTYVDVVHDVFARQAIVPAPPGTVFRSRERLLGWLELHYYTLAEALDFVTDRAVARVTVRRGDPRVEGAVAPTAAPGALRLRPEEDDARGAANDLVALAADAFRELRREAVALIVLRSGPDTAAPDDSAYGSFLIERARWQTFSEAVSVQGRRHAALRLDCSGPWPPYDFVRMQFNA